MYKRQIYILRRQRNCSFLRSIGIVKQGVNIFDAFTLFRQPILKLMLLRYVRERQFFHRDVYKRQVDRLTHERASFCRISVYLLCRAADAPPVGGAALKNAALLRPKERKAPFPSWLLYTSHPLLPENPRHRMDLRHFQRFFKRHVGHNRRNTPRQHRLARAGRPDQ